VREVTDTVLRAENIVGYVVGDAEAGRTYAERRLAQRYNHSDSKV
jgi:hypothetical protein